MLAKKIEDDFKTAMKTKDSLKMATLRMVKAAVANFLIEKKKDTIEDQELMALLQKQVKMRVDSIEAAQKGGRQDIVEKETKEKAILESYLPRPLSSQELEALVKKAIQETGAKGKADMGKVMKAALATSGGRADGRQISQVASKLLT